MKFLCYYKELGEFYRHSGFANALIAAGHQFVFWDKRHKPCYDIFDEYQPDVYIGTSFDLDQAQINCIAERPKMKVILKAGNWGESNHGIDTQKYPIVLATAKELELLEEMKEKLNKPDFVFCHYHPNKLESTMGHWNNIGVKPVALMNAADILVYSKGKSRPELVSDISFVGGYWNYKAQNIRKFLFPLTNPVGRYNIKIWGNQPWPIPQYLGVPNDHLVKDIYASAKICPNISEPHSTAFGFDIVERPFKVLSSGGFLLMDKIQTAYEDIFSETDCAWYTDAESFKEQVDLYLQDSDKKQEILRSGFKTVYDKYTYFHIMAHMFRELDLHNEADKLMEVYHAKFYPKELIDG